MHSPSAAAPDQFERTSLSHRIWAGVVIGLCLIFLLPPEADWETLFEFQTVASLIGAALVFCLVYRFWPAERS